MEMHVDLTEEISCPLQLICPSYQQLDEKAPPKKLQHIFILANERHSLTIVLLTLEH